MNMITVVDYKNCAVAREYDRTFRSDPVEFTIGGDLAWVVGILRVWCPSEIS